MGNSISEAALATFEVANEFMIAIASGIVGISILVYHGITTNHVIRTLVVTSATVGSIIFIFRSSEMTLPSKKRVVFITGCDSGLGFSVAQHAHQIGFTVIAGCLNLNSRGALELHRLFGDTIMLVEVNVTDSKSIVAAVETVEHFLKHDTKYVLWAVVNNAGVMVFGEFEWLTERLIDYQIGINLAGTMKLTKAFCPLLRKYKGRIITVTSHCAEATLPGLSVYGATKAGLAAWSDGIRVELEKYGVKVVTFIPGSFVQKSNIMARQVEYVYEMHSAFTEEQKDFYNDYFKRYNTYLTHFSGPSMPTKIEDPSLYDVFESTLLAVSPRAKYVNEPWRYKFYHLLFKSTPTLFRDILVHRFMQMPEYQQPQQSVVPDLAA